jgi:hypothetical protein
MTCGLRGDGWSWEAGPARQARLGVGDRYGYGDAEASPDGDAMGLSDAIGEDDGRSLGSRSEGFGEVPG